MGVINVVTLTRYDPVHEFGIVRQFAARRHKPAIAQCVALHAVGRRRRAVDEQTWIGGHIRRPPPHDVVLARCIEVQRGRVGRELCVDELLALLLTLAPQRLVILIE